MSRNEGMDNCFRKSIFIIMIISFLYYSDVAFASSYPSCFNRIMSSLWPKKENKIQVAAAQPVSSVKTYNNMNEAIKNLGHPIAYGADGEILKPDIYGKGYYGSGDLTPEKVISLGGIPDKSPKTPSLSLKDHVTNALDENHLPVSSFRGTTEIPVTPGGQGAVYWADEGGYVYEVNQVPMWNVNQHLEGKIKTPMKYGNNMYEGELEYAVPSRLPLECIERWGKVIASGSGSLFVRTWEENLKYNEINCSKYWQ